MENYGTDQEIATNANDIERFRADGFMITACAAQGSDFYIVMTKGTVEYKGKCQKYFTRETWRDVDNKIEKGFKKGRIVTDICYLTELEQYFVVMTEMSHGQCLFWQPNSTKEASQEKITDSHFWIF